jgi:hypothetical protein
MGYLSKHEYSEQEALNAAYVAVRAASSADFSPCRAIHCNTAGTYGFKFREATDVVDMTLVAGLVYPFSVIRVVRSALSPTLKIATSTAVMILP